MILLKNHYFHNIARRAVAVLLILSLLSFMGCEKKEKKPVEGNSYVNSGTESEIIPNTESDIFDPPASNNIANGSNDKKDLSEKIDPISGNITFETIKKANKGRDDDGEIIPAGNCAVLNNKLEGAYESLAEKRREEILNAKNTAEIYQIKGTTYYISPGGDDNNTGTSPNTPLRTVDSVASLNLKEGDAVLFERDSVFRLVSSLTTVPGVIYGSYGKGEKPKLYSSPMNFAEVEWTPSQRKNIWRANYVYDEACSVIFEHGKEIGYRKSSIRGLEKDTDFYQDDAGAVIYLYCSKGNPANIYKSIEISAKMPQIIIPGFSGNVVIDNLCLKYSGNLAIDGHFACYNVTVTNCEIGYIGGAATTSVRLGNAVQCWQGVKGFKVTDCWIYQTFDSAISWQGTANGTSEQYSAEYSDIVINNNLLEFNNGDIEIWDDNELLTGKQEMIGNICRFTSLGWGTRIDDGGYRGIEGVFANCNTSDMDIRDTKIKVYNTIVDCPGREVFSWYIYGTGRNADIGADMWKYFDIKGTKVFINLDYRTIDRVLRGCRRKETQPNLTYYTDNTSLVTALKRFDLNCEIRIIDKWK